MSWETLSKKPVLAQAFLDSTPSQRWETPQKAGILLSVHKSHGVKHSSKLTWGMSSIFDQLTLSSSNISIAVNELWSPGTSVSKNKMINKRIIHLLQIINY